MSKLKVIDAEKGSVGFNCPGCDETHYINIAGDSRVQPVWGFNGNFNAPTITPSVRVTGVYYEHEGHGNGAPMCCHSFITDGNIQFLSDCTHALAGQTVPLPDTLEPRTGV